MRAEASLEGKKRVQVILHSLFFSLGLLVPPTTLNTPMPSAEQLGCPVPNRDVTVENARAADYPDSARSLGLGPVEVLVRVTVGATGSVQSVAITKSSGNLAIDRASVEAARASTYEPKMVNCVATTGDYLFRVEFRPDGPTLPSPKAAPFSAPAFSPPPDWSVVKDLPPQSSNRWVYSAWQKGDAVLTLSGIPVLNALSDIQTQTIGGLKSNGASIARSEMVRICNGTADALLITYMRKDRDKQSDFIADMYARSSHGIYQVIFFSPGGTTLDPSIETSMKSLCAP